MRQSRRRIILLILIGIVLVAIGVFTINNLVNRALRPLPPPTPPPQITEPVVVTKFAIALGAVLKTQDLTLVEVPVGITQPDTISDLGEAVGKITKVPLVAGEMVLKHHLADPTNIHHDLAFVLGETQVLMAFPITDLMSSLNIIDRGDLVDIFVTMQLLVPIVEEEEQELQAIFGPEGEPEKTSVDITFNTLQRLEITAVVVEVVQQQQAAAPSITGAGEPQPTPIPSREATKPRAFLLALSPQDALLLKHLKDSGATFDIVIRSPTSTKYFELNPVTSEYIVERYQLQITR